MIKEQLVTLGSEGSDSESSGFNGVGGSTLSSGTGVGEAPEDYGDVGERKIF